MRKGRFVNLFLEEHYFSFSFFLLYEGERVYLQREAKFLKNEEAIA
jgi:hypothetical protein